MSFHRDIGNTYKKKCGREANRNRPSSIISSTLPCYDKHEDDTIFIHRREYVLKTIVAVVVVMQTYEPSNITSRHIHTPNHLIKYTFHNIFMLRDRDSGKKIDSITLNQTNIKLSDAIRNLS